MEEQKRLVYTLEVNPVVASRPARRRAAERMIRWKGAARAPAAVHEGATGDRDRGVG